MEFGLSNEQQLLENSLRGVLREELSLDKLRKVAGTGTEFAATL